MRQYPRRGPLEMLEPRTADDRRLLYELIREALACEGTPDVYTAQRLALVGVEHLSGEGDRLVLRGDSTLDLPGVARALPEALGLPLVEIDVGALAETNWRGTDLAWYIGRMYRELHRTYQPAMVPSIAARACVVVNHFDRARLPGSVHGSDSTRDYREGKQSSLLPLFDEVAIPVPQSGTGVVWSSGTALVILTAEFADLPTGIPDADDLVSWGMVPALGRALASTTWLMVPPLLPGDFEEDIRRRLAKVSRRFRAYGYTVRFTDQAVNYVTEAVTTGGRAGGPSAAARWIADAAERGLIRLLEEDAPPGTRFVVARDDVSLPNEAEGVWRE